MLRPGGRLCLVDVVFEEQDCERKIQAWIDKLAQRVGPDMLDDATRHVREEYSTFAWIMEGLLERAGFRIEQKTLVEGVLAKYVCAKG